MVDFIAYDSAFYRLSPLLEKYMTYFIPTSISKGMLNHVLQSKAKILSRRERGEHGRKDFCSYLFDMQYQMRLTDWDMTAHSNSMILAGSETSATVLSALTHWLCTTPAVYSKLKEEVRSKFSSSTEITSQNATFPYLTAVIHETLRMLPPVPNGAPRIVSKGGDSIDGVFVPGGVSCYLCASSLSSDISQTTVSVHMWSSTRNPKNFKDPDVFQPERWLDPNCTDNLSASNPFLLGPRACLGQKLESFTRASLLKC
jgi:cytochrome P450